MFGTRNLILAPKLRTRMMVCEELRLQACPQSTTTDVGNLHLSSFEASSQPPDCPLLEIEDNISFKASHRNLLLSQTEISFHPKHRGYLFSLWFEKAHGDCLPDTEDAGALQQIL